MKTIQYITLRLFLVMMFVCASLFLFMIWRGGPDQFDIMAKLMFSSFIVGLASFLVWFVTIIFDIRNKISSR